MTLRAILVALLLLVSATEGQTYNHLRGSRSAYLARAARQPIDWRPWGEEAFALARKLDRPILLDVGATWCGWCNRMDRESYTRPEVAGFINRNFIAVKVDYDADPKFSARLERAQAVLNLPAGLPLTGFITPAGKLYHGGSYFPGKPRMIRGERVPALRAALDEALRLYRTERSSIERDGFQVWPQLEAGSGPQ